MYHVPPAGHPDDEVFDVISGIMNDRTGRLFKALVQEKNMAIRVFGSGGGSTYAGAFSFGGRPREAGASRLKTWKKPSMSR